MVETLLGPEVLRGRLGYAEWAVVASHYVGGDIDWSCAGSTDALAADDAADTVGSADAFTGSDAYAGGWRWSAGGNIAGIAGVTGTGLAGARLAGTGEQRIAGHGVCRGVVCPGGSDEADF